MSLEVLIHDGMSHEGHQNLVSVRNPRTNVIEVPTYVHERPATPRALFIVTGI